MTEDEEMPDDSGDRFHDLKQDFMEDCEDSGDNQVEEAKDADVVEPEQKKQRVKIINTRYAHTKINAGVLNARVA